MSFPRVILLMVWLTLGCGTSPAAHAAQQGLSPQAHRTLARAHEQIDQEQYTAALKTLDKLLERVPNPSYARAITLQTQGYVHTLEEHYPAAIKAFEQSLALETLAAESQQRLRYDLGQLYLATDQPASAVKVLKAWFDNANDPDAEAWYLLGSAHASLAQYREAIPPFGNAIKASATPREPRYQALLAMHYQVKAWHACIPLLEKMIRLFPDAAGYWHQLAQVHMLQDNYPGAVNVLELALHRGMFTKEQDYIQLARLYLYLNIPYKGARLLETGLAGNIVRDNAKNHELLANAWALSREHEKALAAWRRVAQISPKAESDLAIAQLYLQDERWPEAITALESALEKGSLRKPGHAWLLLGIARYETGDVTRARAAFEKAAGFDSSRKSARPWLDHLDEPGLAGSS